MTRALLPAAVAALLVAAGAPADVPLPPNLKYVTPRVAFEGVEKLPDHVFVLRYKTFSGGPSGVPYSRTGVKDDKPFTLPLQRRVIDLKLLAVAKADFDRKAKDDPSLEWLTDKAEGVLAADVPAPPTVGKADAKEVPVTAYRVNLKDGRLAVERVPPAGGADPPDRKRGDTGPAPAWVAGVTLAAGLAGLGLWLARRRPA